MKPKDDKKIAGAMSVGLGMIGIGVILVVLSIVNLYFFIFGIVLFIVGLVVTAVTLAAGLGIEKRSSKGEPVQMSDCQIIGRYAMSEIGEMLFNDLDIDFDNPRTKLYIRLQPPGSGSLELRTNTPVWQSCGEGMRGTAVVEGDWLGSFVGQVGPARLG